MTNQNDSVVQYFTKDDIALISLNRPHQINAFNVQMRDELYEVLSLFQRDTSVKVAIIKGNGTKGFCAGADLSEFGSAPSQIIAREIRWQRDLWGLFLKIQKPIIAQLHGFVIGSGIEIASFCDVKIATKTAKFSMPESSLGLIPAAGGTQTLPRSIGISNSLKMLLTNLQIDAKTAKKNGLINEFGAITKGLIGPLPIAQGHPRIRTLIRMSEIGIPTEPIKIGNSYIIFQLESLKKSKLDDPMKLELSKQLFDQWLDEQVDLLVDSLKLKYKSSITKT